MSDYVVVREDGVRRNVTKTIAWSPDGRYLAMRFEDVNSEIQLWDTTRWEIASVLMPSGDLSSAAAVSLAWSPDGRYFAAGQYPAIVVWDTETWRETRVMDVRGSISALVWSPDSSQLAVAGQTPLEVIRTEGWERRVLEIPDGEVRDVDWTLNGERLVSISFTDGTLRLWDMSSGEELAVANVVGEANNN